MQRQLLIIFCLTFCLAGKAQKIITTKKLVIHPPLKDFFNRNKEVRAVNFVRPWEGSGLELSILKNSLPLLRSLNEFQLRNEGDRYFFEREYGHFDLPESLHQQFTKKMKGGVEVSGTVCGDSVFFTFKQTIYVNEDNKVFVKIESRKDYEGGLHLFARQLEDSLSAIPVSDNDSVLIFWTLLNKNRTINVLDVRLGDSTSAYTNAVRRYINNSTSWIPYETGGRTVRSFQKLYIRRNADGSYRVVLE